jgi:hypothetical protein
MARYAMRSKATDYKAAGAIGKKWKTVIGFGKRKNERKTTSC